MRVALQILRMHEEKELTEEMPCSAAFNARTWRKPHTPPSQALDCSPANRIPAKVKLPQPLCRGNCVRNRCDRFAIQRARDDVKLAKSIVSFMGLTLACTEIDKVLVAAATAAKRELLFTRAGEGGSGGAFSATSTEERESAGENVGCFIPRA